MTRRVLKLNQVREIETGVYIYQQMLSVFADADRLEPVKLTVTSHEWCGNCFVEWRADRSSLAIRSYFEQPGDVDVPLLRRAPSSTTRCRSCFGPSTSSARGAGPFA